MGEPKWTQGEWHAFMGYLTSPDGKEYPTAEVLCDGRGIATVHWPLDDPEEFFANARVLAAAKDLYEACEKARNVLALIETFDELIRTPRRRFEEAIDAIDLALLKARGESDGN